MGQKVFIIDDDQKLQDLLKEYLEGYGFETIASLDGDGVENAILKNGADIVILDLMLPERDGFDILKGLKQISRVPVLMLTARGEDTDRIIGLEMGADDYLPKPFNPRELLARIKAILRRIPVGDGNAPAIAANERLAESIEVAGMILFPGRQSLQIGDDEMELSTTEYKLLEALMENPGRVLTRDELMNHARGREHLAFDRSIDVHISRIRSRLDRYEQHRNRIKTVWGTGYMLLTK